MRDLIFYTYQLHVVPVVDNAVFHGVREAKNSPHRVRLITNIIITVVVMSHRLLRDELVIMKGI
mgnify:CR=1 FL=1